MKINFKLLAVACAVDKCLSQKDDSMMLGLKGKHIAIGMECGGRSHVKYLFEISTVLQERGHRITYASPDHYLPFAKGYNVTHYSLGHEHSDPDEARKRWLTWMEFKSRDFYDLVANGFVHHMEKFYDTAFPKYIQFFHEFRPDLIICDFFSSACYDAARSAKIPLIIGFQSLDMAGVVPVPDVTQTFDLTATTTLGLTFWQRFNHKIWLPLKRYYNHRPAIRKMNQVRAKYNIPPASQLFGDWNNALLLANSYFNLESPRYLPPNVKLIGPIITLDPTPLSNDLNQFLARYEKIAYIAFGSLVILNTGHIQQLMGAILMALENGIIDAVIWGLGSTSPDDFPNHFQSQGQTIRSKDILNDVYPNMRISSWAPQQTLLSNVNVRLFLSHGGLESTVEAIYTGTPILSYPFIADQLRNGLRVHELGIGYYIDRFDTSSTVIYENIVKIITDKDKSIARNLRKMQVLTKTGARRKIQAADIIEEYAYVAEICKMANSSQVLNYPVIPCEMEHLIPANQNMSFITAYAIDVYTVAIALILLFLFMFCIFISAIFPSIRLFSPFSKRHHKHKTE